MLSFKRETSGLFRCVTSPAALISRLTGLKLRTVQNGDLGRYYAGGPEEKAEIFNKAWIDYRHRAEYIMETPARVKTCISLRRSGDNLIGVQEAIAISK